MHTKSCYTQINAIICKETIKKSKLFYRKIWKLGQAILQSPTFIRFQDKRESITWSANKQVYFYEMVIGYAFGYNDTYSTFLLT